MAQHVIIGAGSIGSNVARLLAERGETSVIVTRSGSGPKHDLIERVAADASDPARLTEISRGAKAIYHCANPSSYTTWQRLLPPLQDSVIAAAKANDAVLAITASLYAYGPQPGGRMNEHTPMAATTRKGVLRRELWEQTLASGVRTFEARGADYIGKDSVSIYSQLFEPALKKGGTAYFPGDLDVPHTFTYNVDMANTLVTLAADERAWGRAWHVPSAPAITVRELVKRYAIAAGRPQIKLVSLPRFVMRTAGVAVPIAREMAEMDYQWYAPFHMDSSETARTFGLQATDINVAIREQVSGIRLEHAHRAK